VDAPISPTNISLAAKTPSITLDSCNITNADRSEYCFEKQADTSDLNNHLTQTFPQHSSPNSSPNSSPLLSVPVTVPGVTTVDKNPITATNPLNGVNAISPSNPPGTINSSITASAPREETKNMIQMALDPCNVSNPNRPPSCFPKPAPIRLVPPEINLLSAQGASVSGGGTTLSTPSASGAYWGVAGVGISYQGRARFTNKQDAAAGIGIGFGDPKQNVGIQLGIGLVDISNLLADGSLSLKLHRKILPDLSIAIGANGFQTWGSPDGGSTLYGVATKRWKLRQSPQLPFSEVTVSAGLGGGQFRSQYDVSRGRNTIGTFGSVAVKFAEPLNGIIEWTGQDMNLGISFVPFLKLPIVTTFSANDVLGTAGDGPRFSAGIGVGFSFLDWFK
jgi:hypothetical protein